jgi:hypothetical protein
MTSTSKIVSDRNEKQDQNSGTPPATPILTSNFSDGSGSANINSDTNHAYIAQSTQNDQLGRNNEIAASYNQQNQTLVPTNDSSPREYVPTFSDLERRKLNEQLRNVRNNYLRLKNCKITC